MVVITMQLRLLTVVVKYNAKMFLRDYYKYQTSFSSVCRDILYRGREMISVNPRYPLSN